MDKAANQSQEAMLDTKPVVVQSAKDAINAMYADKSQSSLGDYLANSAEEIKSSQTSKKNSTDAKSASSIHRHSGGRKMESTRTSASALLKVAGSKKDNSAVPVTHTSLKLTPKKPGVRVTEANPSSQTTTNRRALRPKKSAVPLNSTIHTPNPQVFQDVVRPGGSTKRVNKSQPSIVSQNTVKVNTDNASGALVTQSTPVKKAVQLPTPSTKIAAPHVARPNQGSVVDFVSRKVKVAKPTPVSDTPKKSKSGPFDSIKKRFAPAPKGYSASTDEQARPDRPYRPGGFVKPGSSTVKNSTDKTQFYSLDDSSHSLGTPEGQPNRDQIAMNAGLGVIEDYHSDGSSTPESGEPTVLRREGPDNNKYALSSQSPYYLKNAASIEKRPLSGNGVRRRPVEVATSVYAGQNLDLESKKNQYSEEPDKKSKKPAKKAKKSKSVSTAKPAKATKGRNKVDAHPTVIIPSRSRSSAPMVALLLLTVLLGAIVGALAYLFFFQ